MTRCPGIEYRTQLAFEDMESGWPELLEAAERSGRSTCPRGLPALELERVMFTLTDPGKAVVASPARKLNHAFSAAEFCWVMAAQDEVETLAYFNSKMRDFADVDKVEHVPATGDAGGYPMTGAGLKVTPNARLFGAYGPPIRAQMSYVLEALGDRDSRQAVMTIWRPSPPRTKDVPCTVAIQFLLRDGRLNAMVVMRSNDLWLGTPYDVPLFCRVQSYVASRLGVPVGEYTHVAGSLHLYERDRNAARVAALPAATWRPQELVVGPFDPTVNPDLMWRAVGRIVAGHRVETHAAGWGDLVRLMDEYALRRRQREKEAETHG